MLDLAVKMPPAAARLCGSTGWSLGLPYGHDFGNGRLRFSEADVVYLPSVSADGGFGVVLTRIGQYVGGIRRTATNRPQAHDRILAVKPSELLFSGALRSQVNNPI